MFHSLHYEPRKLEATEARLERIYAAAKLGLKGDALALASGMLPTEYRQLTQLDPLAELAELKGRADAEIELSTILHDCAKAGDGKIALEILKHQHKWTPAQTLNINIEERISITAALEMAQTRVIDVLTQEVQDTAPEQLNHQKQKVA